MSLASDYFILYHGLHLSKDDHIEIDKCLDEECFFEVCALILCVNRKNFEKISRLMNFNLLCKKFTPKSITHLDELYHLQYSLIQHFITHRSHNNLVHIHKSFNYLLDEEVLTKDSYEKLVSLFDPLCFKDKVTETERQRPLSEQGFHSVKQEILLALSELLELFTRKESLVDINSYLNDQRFSIGVTGVMNAGKSSMLNALLGKEILGTSVVPETASLTIIRYADKPYANVVYWNRSQWKRIEQSAEEIKPMAGFIKETKEYFEEDLDAYILEKSREDKIKIEDLSIYTSAAESSKRCNLVKQVELGSDLHFLRDGIEIVDTPGLDDIVIQREEITKEYLAHCDLLIHLMNVSQSVTSKDIEFIIDALLYQNITKILIVITRIDTVSAKDVEEVIRYTKESISAQLHKVNEDAKLDFILRGLHFIGLSSKMALLHRSGGSQEAIDAGFTLEQSGMIALESYLRQTLFSKDNEKSALIIHSARHRLSKSVKTELERMGYELSLLSKSKDELLEELEHLQVLKSVETKRLKLLSEQIRANEEELSSHLDTQKLFLDKELNKLQGVIKQRLFDEARYSLYKDKKHPNENSYKAIIEKAIKYGLVDIVRDYSYHFTQKAIKIEEALFTQNKDLFDKPMDTQTLFGDSFNKGFLTSNNEVLVERLIKLLLASSIKSLADIDQEMTLIIKQEFVHLEELTKSRASEISNTILQVFFHRLRVPLQVLTDKLYEDEALLNKQLESIEEDDTSRTQQSIQLHKRIKMIETIAKRCHI